MEATRVQLAQGVYLTYLPARKFKTSLLSAQFVTPLRQDTAGANALLAAVLRRGTVSCPDMGALSARMDHLYDASIAMPPAASGCWNRWRSCWANWCATP